MTPRIAAFLTALTLVGVLAIPSRGVAARHQATGGHPYVLIDLGTFGGPQSYWNLPAIPINAQGIVLGSADTTISDTDYPNFNLYLVGFPDPYVVHAFAWHRGVLTDLGALPGNNGSAIFELTARGVGAGMSENGTIDPVTGWPAVNATLWKDGHIVNLGTLPGGYESMAIAINEQGQVMGFASNGIPDPFSMGGWGTQARGVVWQNGVMHDLGTLGGPDSWAIAQNARGQVAGWSYTSAISNATTGVPTQDPFLWQDGHMRDLGNLGGTLSFVNWMSDRGEVVGGSNLAGDQTTHPFLWDGQALHDLGTLGGSNGSANGVTEAGVVVGVADLPGSQTHHGFLWRQGHMTDLGTANGDPCSYASSANVWGQVVGSSTDCHTQRAAFLWEHGSLFDVNTLIAPSDLHVTEAEYINTWGEILGKGVFPNGAERIVLLLPAHLAASEGVTSNAPAPGTTGAGTLMQEPAASCPMVWARHVRLAAELEGRCR